jgi:hypothetical protein
MIIKDMQLQAITIKMEIYDAKSVLAAPGHPVWLVVMSRGEAA